MQEQYECGHCGRQNAKDELVVQKKANNLVARCPACDAFIKNLPQNPGAPAVLYFGKYHGWTLAEVAKNDSGYLQWLMNQAWCKPKLVSQIREALHV